MKRFTEDAIYQRMLQRLTIMTDWSNIIDNGTISSVLHTISEGNSELARYLEYLYNEKKWRNARNMSSLVNQADLISYKRALPKSAIGFIIVSHTDVNGKDRLSNFGSTFFDLDQASDFDNALSTPISNTSYIEKDALVPWVASDIYTIPKGTIFKSGKGISFISIEDVSSRMLKESYASINSNPLKKADFIKAGGWNGIKYLKVPVIQGEIININFGKAKGTKFESFAVDTLDIENASNVISDEFLKVTISYLINDNTVTEIWDNIRNIRLAGPHDKVFEMKILSDEPKVLIKFGDSITGKLIPEGALVKLQYLETRGEAGNVNERYQITEMKLANSITDPRDGSQSQFLSCTNIVPIMGGKDIENEEDLRVNAPPSYLQSYATATKNSYYEQILKNSPVSLLHCRIFQSGIISINSYGDKGLTTGSRKVLQELSTYYRALLITAIKSNGEKIVDPQHELIEPLIKAFEYTTSPNDSFDYIEPNMIEIRPSIVIYSKDSVTEQEMQAALLPEILAKYSIFNTTFEKSYYKSDIINMTQAHTFTKYCEIYLENKISPDMTPIILSRVEEEKILTNTDDDKVFLSFKFNFDKLFSQNKLNAGFKNFRVKSPYVIRADILFETDPSKNKTLLLIDRRTKLQDVLTLEEAHFEKITQSENIMQESFNIEEHIFFDEYSESFQNNQVRTAQYNYIDDIITPSYFFQMEQFNIEPYEIRPLEVDEFGKNKIFDKNLVSESEQVNINLSQDQNITGTQCYKKNSQWERCKIEFNEDYENPTSERYASGEVILPLGYLFNKADIEALKSISNSNDLTEAMRMLLTEQVQINIYASPLEEKFDTENPYTIIYSKRENIQIQKIYEN